MSQDVTLSMPAIAFNHFSDLIWAFNQRTDKANKGLKKIKYQKVARFPTGHVGNTITVCVAIKDRSKILWQDLSGLLDKFKLEYPVLKAVTKPAPVPAKAVSSPIQAPSRQWGLWVPCESEEAARAAAGFLQAIAKVGQPQVECRG
jgi:hypothetical protein